MKLLEVVRTDEFCIDNEDKMAEICGHKFVEDARAEPVGREVAGDGDVTAAAAMFLFNPQGADCESEQLLDTVASTVMQCQRVRRVETLV